MQELDDLEFDIDIDDADDFDYDNSGAKIQENSTFLKSTDAVNDETAQNQGVSEENNSANDPITEDPVPPEAAKTVKESNSKNDVFGNKDGAGTKQKRKKKKPGRRRRKIVAFILATAAFLCSAVIYFRGEDMDYTVTRYQVSSDKITADLRIVFLSDLHDREYGENNDELFSSVQSLSPDLIVLGGDFVTFPHGDSSVTLSLFKRLTTIAPCYAVLGNHEMEEIYSGNDETLADKISETGVTLLRNENSTIELNGNTIDIVGLEGATTDYELYGESKTVDNLTESYKGIRLCVCHVPQTILDHMQNSSVDLYLSGHTHGGLMNLPVVGRLYTREEGLFPKHAYGKYSLKSGATLIIGGGLGDSHDVLRVGNKPEIVVVDISSI